MENQQHSFINNLLKGDRTQPPNHCLDVFNERFPNASALEWNALDDQYEVIFYQNELEHMATFTSDGQLVDYRMKLQEDLLPAMIKTLVHEKGELMNDVLINRGNALNYEIIFRDDQLVRYQLELDQLGQILVEKEL